MTLDAQIASVKREIALRKNVYPKWVSSEKMRVAEMEHEIAAMTAALHTLMAVRRLRSTMTAHQYVGRGLNLCSCGEADNTSPSGDTFESWLDHVFERSKAAKSYEIAEHFLADEQNVTEAHKEALAQFIQNEIEEWIEFASDSPRQFAKSDCANDAKDKPQ